jgi:hypothetical protein
VISSWRSATQRFDAARLSFHRQESALSADSRGDTPLIAFELKSPVAASAWRFGYAYKKRSVALMSFV